VVVITGLIGVLYIGAMMAYYTLILCVLVPFVMAPCSFTSLSSARRSLARPIVTTKPPSPPASRRGRSAAAGGETPAM